MKKKRRGLYIFPASIARMLAGGWEKEQLGGGGDKKSPAVYNRETASLSSFGGSLLKLLLRLQHILI